MDAKQKKQVEKNIFVLCRYYEREFKPEIAQLIANADYEAYEREEDNGFGFPTYNFYLHFQIPIDKYLEYLHDENILENITYNYCTIAQIPPSIVTIKFQISEKSYNENWRTAYNYNISSNIKVLEDVAKNNNFESILQQLKRVDSSVTDDPELAIGSSKELLESTAKIILDLRNIPYPTGANMPELLKSVRKELKLVPDETHSAKKGNDLIKRVLSDLANIGNNIEELRNIYGTGHGSNTKKGLQARHARLVVGTATTLCVFLFETHEFLIGKNKTS